MIDTIRKLLAPLQRRIMLMVSRGVINMVNDTLGIQGVQVKLLDGEISEMERFQDYGLTSVPPDKSEHVAVFIGGNRDHGVVIKCDNRKVRLKGLKKGEVAIYTDEGDNITLKRGHTIEVNATGAASKVIVNSMSVQLGGPTVDPTDGVVTGKCACCVYGNPHTVVSPIVKAKFTP